MADFHSNCRIVNVNFVDVVGVYGDHTVPPLQKASQRFFTGGRPTPVGRRCTSCSTCRRKYTKGSIIIVIHGCHCLWRVLEDYVNTLHNTIS